MSYGAFRANLSKIFEKTITSVSLAWCTEQSPSMSRYTQDFSDQALHCRTLPQFKSLIKSFHQLVPYTGVLYGWGYRPKFELLYWKHCQHFPRRIFNEYLHQGFIHSDPVMKECFQRQKCQISSQVFKRLNSIRMNAAYRQFLRENPLRISLSGTYKDPEVAIFFVCTMKSNPACRQAYPYFSVHLPNLLRALKRTFPFPQLSPEEIQILNLLSLGWTKHRIAKQVGQSIPKISSHLVNIKHTFYASNIESAVRKSIAIGTL